MALNRARRLINMQLTRPGVLYTNIALRNQFPAPQPGAVDGITWYYNAAVPNNPFLPPVNITDLLLWVYNGFLFAGPPGANPLTDTVQAQLFVGGGITGYTDFGPFFGGKRVRFFALGEEVIAVQEGGLLPLRFYFTEALGTGFFRAGFDPPISDATSAGDNLTLTPTGTGLTGDYIYKLTFADERFRESSPTPGLTIASLTNDGVKATINHIGYADPANGIYNGSNYKYAYLYRNTQGVPDTYYQIARHTITTLSTHSTTPINPQDFTTGDFYYDAAVSYDNAPDASITGSELAPAPGENDPPLPASVGCVHKNHVFLNAISDPNTLQVSNLGSATQFAVLPVLPTDGGRFQIGTDQGNVITALVEFGSVLAIFKRRGAYFLYGDTIADFIVRPIHQRGCVAPDSCVRCDNVVCFLSDDGVYAAAYEAGDSVTKISKEIEALLLSLPQSVFEAAVAWYVDYRYHLAIGENIFVYDFFVQGWTNYIFGSGAIDLGGGVPPVDVAAGVGFTGNLANSSMYGSVVPCEGGGNDGGACDVAVDPLSLLFTGDGGTASLDVAPANSTATPYVSYALWLGINGPQFGPGTATVMCEPNPTCQMRFGVVQVCQMQIAVTQEASSDTSLCPCAVTSLTPDEFDVDHTAQTATTHYVLSSAAAVSPIFSFAPWLHPQAAVIGTPTAGSVDIDVDANTTCQDRTGQVQICDMLVTVNQAADPLCGCNVAIDPAVLHIAPGATGSGSFQVTNLTAGAYSCTTDNPAAVMITNCPGNSGAGVFNCTFDYDGNFFDPVTDGVAHIFLCNAVFTIIADQHS